MNDEPSATADTANPERIARGGMGEIFRAEDADLARIVAIKVLADRYANDEAIRARFTREALAAARLSDAPSTVTIFDVGEHDDHPYIVMEYLSGGSLADRLVRDGAQPIGRSLDWLGQAAAALDAAHASGIVHRDVKPANLLLDSDNRVKVADFGVASAVGLGSLTEVGTVVGTAGYLAPEQARGEKATPASDRYALAVVAFELLTGRAPFERESSTAEALAHVQRADPAGIAPQSRAAAAGGRRPRPRAREGSGAPVPTRQPTSSTHFDDALARRRAAGRTRRRAAPRSRRVGPPLARCADRARRSAGRRASSPQCCSPATTRRRPRRPPPKTVKETSPFPAHDESVQTVTHRGDAAATAPETPAPVRQPFGAERPGLRADAAPATTRARYHCSNRRSPGCRAAGAPHEAYASYNLAFTRLALGRCDGRRRIARPVGADSGQAQGDRQAAP